MRAVLLAALGLLANCAGGGSPPISQTSPPTAAPLAATPTPPAGEERLIFADEFTGPALDRAKWTAIGPDFWVNAEEQAYIDSPETIRVRSEDGVLLLQPHHRPGTATPTGRRADFVSGRIVTQGKFDFTYGRAVARIRMPDARGVWPAFWLLGNGQWPQTGEIDIMEYVGEPGWTAVALHGPGYSGDTPLVERQYFPAGTDVTGWHEYEAEWDRDQIVFKVDGRPFYRVTKAMVEQHGRWAFDTPQHVILNFAVGGIYPYKVNNIETPYKGVPQSTVDRIKNGELFMEVDWVRVYQRGS